MEYKIEYTPVYVKKDLISRKIHAASAGLMLAGVVLFAVLLWCNRENVLYTIRLLEQMAIEVQQADSAMDAIAAFYETLQGGIGG